MGKIADVYYFIKSVDSVNDYNYFWLKRTLS